jgi:TRAP-type transport system periplasmic protein
MTRFDSSRRVAAITCAVLAAGASAAAADTLELRMASLAPSGSRWEKKLTEAANKVGKSTDGRVKVTYFWDGGQGDEIDSVRKIGTGQLDGAAVTSVGLGMIEKSIRVLELPRMFESVEELDYVSKKMWPSFQKKFEKKGYQLGPRGDVGWIYFLSKNEVKTLKSLKDQKVWYWSDDALVKAMFDELGIAGVPLGVPEVDSGLGHTINACYGPPLAAMTLGWANKVKYMTSMPMSYAIGATVIKLDSLKKLSKDDKKTIDKITKNAAKELSKNVRKDNEEAKKQMKRKGIKIVDVDADMVAKFDAAAEKVWKKLVGKVYSQDDLDTVLKYRQEYRDKKKK